MRRPAAPALARGLVLVATLRAAAGGADPVYVEITEDSAIRFVHANGAAGEKQYWETMGSGVCLFDYDGDGRLDVYLVTCVGGNRLYRNVGGLRFEDVTEPAGVGDESYGMGAVAADIDNDGDPDLYVTNFHENRLYVNRGDGTFREESASRGVDDALWGCGAAFLDADEDGWLDLYVANYVHVAEPDTNVCLARDGKLRLVCEPTEYPAAPDVFYRNRGDGTFEDRTGTAGIAGHVARGLGVVASDFDRDGFPDLYVANDLDPNLLFRNRGDGTFEEVAYFAGTSHSEDGREESGMGVAAGDYDNDGRIDLFVTNFVRQTNTLYHNEGEGFFLDETAGAHLGRPSLPYIGWGTGFVDFDGDGLRDLFVVNGHVEPDADVVTPTGHWKQPDFLFRNRGDGTFEDVTHELAPGFLTPHAGRGAAVGDLDGDGDPDLLVVNQNGPVRLFENRRGGGNGWIGFRAVGTRSNRDGVGARVEVFAADLHSVEEVRAGSSFLSSHDPRVLFGLGVRAEVDSVVVTWPSGRRDTHRDPAPRRYHLLVEGK